ncbi:hypothetical protein JI747_003295 [Chryseobacterium sp. RG1]|uniref:PepSY domain-containing protein n=1 Tax=Chryseobacterium tagetis TaxID=2801334 RepID=A0ABS7ZWT5_9FLAO|nr:hypothetical protein [Chryseobacterium tagetis]MCA6066189.1 hypothetical protein [Chryseobacterium tagetis]
MNIKYLIFFLFLCINIFSQDKIELKEQCRSKYDSVFKDFFGEEFLKKNIKYKEEESYIGLFTTNDIESDDDFKRIFININNIAALQKYLNQYPKYYNEYYKYHFLYKGFVFHQRIYTCEFAYRKEVNDFSNNQVLEYYNKIKNKEYLSPKKAVKIAKANGFKNICYQSITNASFHNKNQDVWQIQDCGNEKNTKVIELDPKSGKVLTLFERDYGKGEKASYWKLFNKSK